MDRWLKKRELTNQKGRIKSGQGFRLFLVLGFRNPSQVFIRKLLFLWRDAPSAGGWGDGAFKMLYSWWGSVKLFKDSYDGGISWEGFSLNQFFFHSLFCLLTIFQDLVIFGFFSFSLHTSLFSIFPYLSFFFSLIDSVSIATSTFLFSLLSFFVFLLVSLFFYLSSISPWFHRYFYLSSSLLHATLHPIHSHLSLAVFLHFLKKLKTDQKLTSSNKKPVTRFS